jgi:peptidoglycan/LPS O-acetylase OafA/YrhL
MVLGLTASLQPAGPGGSSAIVPLGLLVLTIIAVAAVVLERGRRAATRVRAMTAVSAKGMSAPVRADSQAKPDVPSPPLPLIDSLRAIAALSVLLVHAEFYSGMEASPTLGPYAQRLDVGVSGFFVIAGLLLYRPFAVARLRDRAGPDTKAYAWRRFLRIMPAYWLALTVVGLFFTESATAPAVFSSEGFPRYYLLIQNYWTSSIGGGMGQAWTLSIEVAFYVMLPLYAWLQRGFGVGSRRHAIRSEVIGIVGLLWVSEAWQWYGLTHVGRISPWFYTLPAYLDQFALGMALALLNAWIEVARRTPRWVTVFDRLPTASWLLAAAAFWAVSLHAGPNRVPSWAWSPIHYMARHWLYGAIGVCLVLPAVVGDQRRGLARRVLRVRSLAWLGVISYGIYLWHVQVLIELNNLGFASRAGSLVHPYLAWPGAALLITVVIAAISWNLLERPALSLRRLVAGNRPPPAPLAVIEVARTPSHLAELPER